MNQFGRSLPRNTLVGFCAVIVTLFLFLFISHPAYAADSKAVSSTNTKTVAAQTSKSSATSESSVKTATAKKTTSSSSTTSSKANAADSKKSSAQSKTAAKKTNAKDVKLSTAATSTASLNTNIMGTSQTTVSQMVNYYNKHGKKYPSTTLAKGGASTIADFCTILLKQAKSEGVRAEVVFVQAMLETGWLQYGGDAKVTQFNFAGIGTTGGGVKGHSFSTVAEGLLAQVQHLKAYASTAKLKTKCVDPRFNLVSRGCAPKVEDLAGKWAVPGVDYGVNLRAMMGVLLSTSKATSAATKASGPIPNGTYVIAPVYARDMCIDVKNGSAENGAHAIASYTCGAPNQKWTLKYDSGTGTYTITSAFSNKCLDVEAAKAKNGANILQWNSNNGANQKWIISKSGSGYTIATALKGLTYVLDIDSASTNDGAQIRLWKRNNQNNQRFVFTRTSISKAVVSNGTYFITSKLDADKVVEVKGASTGNGANVQLNQVSGSNGQKWTLTYNAASNYYTVKSLKSGKLLTAASSNVKNGTNVVQNKSVNRNTVRWRLVKNTDGSIRFCSLVNTKYLLDVEGNSSADGTNIELWSTNGGDNQRFYLKKATSRERTVKDGAYIIAPSHASNKSLDVAGASSADGANVMIYDAHDDNNQKWFVNFDPWTGYYTIKSASSEKYLDASGGRAAAGTNVLQWSANNGLNQKWLILPHGSHYVIASALDPTYVLDVEGCSTKNGANVLLWTRSNNANQRFALSTTKVKSKFRVYLDAGHGVGSSYVGQYDPGAMGSGHEEGVINAELVNLTAKYARELYGLDVYSNVGSNVQYFNRQAEAKNKGCTAFVSVHFNSYNGSASGTESYIHESKAAKGSSKLQSIMHKKLVSALGLQDRGKKTAAYAVLNGSATKIPATLLEIAFIDNGSDMRAYVAKKDKVARALAAGLYEASKAKI